jgi:hypothetical protein
VGRYLRGETNAYPLMPRNYFDADTVTALADLEREAMTSPREELHAEVSGMLEKLAIENTWHTTAVCLYRNWLQYICAQKKLQLQRSRVAADERAMDGLMPLPAAVENIAPPVVFTTTQPDMGITSIPARTMLTIL